MAEEVSSEYRRQGFISPVTVISESAARRHRRALEAAEARIGAMHYLCKVHTILRSPYRLATHPALLDTVEQILGPDIMLYDSTYIIKEARSSGHVSWHQDLTYWGLDGDDQVSAWLALSVADERSGCMRMIPGSHRAGRRRHDISAADEDNVLLQSQTVHGVDETAALHCPLRPGQASLHHGWTLHASAPNQSARRRIGLNVQYVAPHVRQVKKPGFSALLVRGEDRYGYYAEEVAARGDLQPAAVRRREEMEALYQSIAGTEV